jgi:dihydrofolate reductase
MNYNIIVAICENNGIGYNNSLPWNIKEDLKIFSKLTKGNNNNAIIMGRNTFESLPNNFLPKRDNLILSSSIIIDEKRENNIIKTFDNIDSIIEFCNSKNYQEVWIIGGQLIYESFLRKNIVNKLFITKINKKYLCDKFFYYNEKEWKVAANEKLKNIENIDIDLLIYEK